MKYYETHFEEYIQSVQKFNLHPELLPILNSKTQSDNILFYGPSGSGKYSQALFFLSKFSPTFLKYEKRITIYTDKHNFIYRISDILYEIDMSLLGCNSKILWHEIFFQIVDIISAKTDKWGVIVCRNFHQIQTELLDNFYSYIQQYNTPFSQITIKFILLTEQISFIPDNILDCFHFVRVKIPEKSRVLEMFAQKPNNKQPAEIFSTKISPFRTIQFDKIQSILDTTDSMDIMHIKEICSFELMSSTKDIPPDIFNIVCDEIIHEMENPTQIVFTHFRDVIYNILIYNIDVSECIWYVFSHFVKSKQILGKDVTATISKIHIFLKYFNNNYRPIYHLESIFFFIIVKIYGYHEL